MRHVAKHRTLKSAHNCRMCESEAVCYHIKLKCVDVSVHFKCSILSSQLVSEDLDNKQKIKLELFCSSIYPKFATSRTSRL